MKLDHDIILVDTTEVMDEYDSTLVLNMKDAIDTLLEHTRIDIDYVSTAEKAQKRRAFLESEGKKILPVRVARSLPEEITTDGYFKVEVTSKDVGVPGNAFIAVHFRKEYKE